MARGQRNGYEEADHPIHVRLHQAEDALEHRRGQVRCVLFFFEFDQFIVHNLSPVGTQRRCVPTNQFTRKISFSNSSSIRVWMS